MTPPASSETFLQDALPRNVTYAQDDAVALRNADAPATAAEVAGRFRKALEASSYTLTGLAREFARDDGATDEELPAKVQTIRSQLQKLQRGATIPEPAWAGRLSGKLGRPLHYFNVPAAKRPREGRRPTAPLEKVLERLDEDYDLLRQVAQALGVEPRAGDEEGGESL